MSPKEPLPPAITNCLRQLRRQVRRYVWLQGLALALAWVGLAYWVGLALDYLPVLAGSSEMPRAARISLLVVISTVLIWIVYRWILRRAFVRLTDGNLAVLLERRFPQLQDTLLTAVDGQEAETPDPRDARLHEAMRRRAIEQAAKATARLETGQVLDRRPLLKGASAAAIALLSIALFALLAGDAWGTWTCRFLLLSDAPWPRRASIELLGFSDKKQKVAEGSDLTIRVRADQNRFVPEFCWIDYQLGNGDRGRANMSRDGEARDGYQYFRFEGTPFQGMLDTVDFDVVGFDHRLPGFRVDVVPSPSITTVDLRCELPSYLNALPREQRWAPGTTMPLGTQIQLIVRATKPLQEVRVEDALTGEKQIYSLPDDDSPEQRLEFRFDLPRLDETAALKIELLDDDLVTSEQPYLITITAVEDLVPEVDIRLEGIGTAITPDAKLPLQGEITDDYEVSKVWFQISNMVTNENRTLEFPTVDEGEFAETLDLRLQRAKSDAPWQVRPGDKILLGIRASDECDLDDSPRIGKSDDFPLDVVTPDELLALLEARELGLKERFEQVLAELNETRDNLLRLQAELTDADDEPPQTNSEGATVDNEIRSQTQILTLRHLRVQRAEQQGMKSQREIEGVGEAFADIREQLINNRVDTPERNKRLEDQIIGPIRNVVDGQFPGWLQQLSQLDVQLDDREIAIPMTQQSVAMANSLIYSLEQILQNMLELETYNELVDIVRSIIEDQERIQRETAEERKRQARGLLED